MTKLQQIEKKVIERINRMKLFNEIDKDNIKTLEDQTTIDMYEDSILRRNIVIIYLEAVLTDIHLIDGRK